MAAQLPAIQLTEVTRDFDLGQGGKITALEGVNLVIALGQVVGLLGKSGSGKTTLMKLIAGLEPVTRGTVSIFGESLASMEARLHPQVQYVSLRTIELDPHRTVLENLLMHRPTEEAGEQALAFHPEELLAALSLNQVQPRLPGSLPGGLQDRVALACALASGASILLVDDLPGFDPETVSGLRGWLYDQPRRLGQVILFASRNREALLPFCDRVVALRQGRVVFDDLIEKAKHQPDARVYRIRLRGRLDPAWSAWFSELPL